MNTEAMAHQEGQMLDYTPTAARTAGQVVQTGGKAGICVADIEANVKGAAQVAGIIKIVKVQIAGIAGDVVGWDEDGNPYGGTAGTGALTTNTAAADFLVGTLIADMAATDTAAYVDLNKFDVVLTRKVVLTAVQIKALAATQQTLVPAPGADKYNQVLGITMILNYGSEVLAEPSAPDDLEVVYNAAGGTSIADVIGDFVIGSADAIATPQIKNIAGAAATTVINKAVVLDNNGGEYTGNATNDTTITIITTYTIVKAGLA